MSSEMKALEAAIGTLVEKASGHGLDFFDMRFEICPSSAIHTVGAYGMPHRFAHWSFGKMFHHLRTRHELGMAVIYELVINTDPCYAFLLQSNSLLQNKLITAHVLAHSDFFRHNCRFLGTNRQMIPVMSAFADRVRSYTQRYGADVVEPFLDAVLAVSDQVSAKEREPGEDLLLFLLMHATHLAPWQQDIVSSVRSEALYFRPQMETKILNEGWATFWHARLMREMDLTPEESIDFARMQAQLLAPPRLGINPYNLGYHLLVDMERRFGTERLFEVRELESDLSLIRNYLTPEVAAAAGLYLFERQGGDWRVSSTNWQHVRERLLRQLENCGHPYILAVDADFRGQGELYLRHCYDGIELDVPYLRHTLGYLWVLWGRAVHLETVEDGHLVVYRHDGVAAERALIA